MSTHRPSPDAAAELRLEMILRAVELVPPGQVASYGDVAAVVGTGPRQVGAAMARWGSSVAWWRITSAAGELGPQLVAEALPHWREEGIEPKENGRGCRIARHRVDLDELARRWRQATAELDAARP